MFNFNEESISKLQYRRYCRTGLDRISAHVLYDTCAMNIDTVIQ